jgi:RNA polymerase sigma factor (sigma-70 family)
MNACELLTAYRETGSEKAFGELLRQYTNFVYSVARRRLAEGRLAEDATQLVFSRIAKAPPCVGSDGEWVSWLHRTATHVAIDFWRSETRRRAREQQAALMQSNSGNDSHPWEELCPHLDQALDELADSDRQAVLLRFFEGRPMREIGQVFGVSEDAAKMRVSRAIDRLRDRLSLRGITSTVLVLGTLLPDRGVEAAPAHLIARLGGISLLPPPAGGASGLGGLVRIITSRTGMGVTAALVLGITGAVFLLNSQPEAREEVLPANAVQERPPRQGLRSLFGPSTRTSEDNLGGPGDQIRFILRVLDRETGVGLAGAQTRVAYFYAGGVGERHQLESDFDGNVSIPYQNRREKPANANVFVALAGYVPQVIRLGKPGEDYVLELDRAVAVGGTVVDESGRPVVGVTLEARRMSTYGEQLQRTNQHGLIQDVDFQTTPVTTDSNGRWLFQYVPREYGEIDFYLTCSAFAVTQVSVPVGKPESLNALLLIERGSSVMGRVIDMEGRPVAGATVKERHEYGCRKLFTSSDKDGYYALHGLGGPIVRSKWPEEKIELTVESPGMASQRQSIQLSGPTNTLDFTLAEAKAFRGRVLDEAGNAICGAVVRTDSHFDPYVPTRFDWLTYTDESGRFEWNSAPGEETCYWFQADGYEIIRGRPMLADGAEHEIRLKPAQQGRGD